LIPPEAPHFSDNNQNQEQKKQTDSVEQTRIEFENLIKEKPHPPHYNKPTFQKGLYHRQ
jgi:hypothetical protein